MEALPVDPFLPSILAAVEERRGAVVVAPPGSGKTTRIPPALAKRRRTILLQPRRVAARALTRRIAAEQHWSAGEEIGWQIRFERRFSDRTQLLVATEGILTARLQSDPLLSEFGCVILDEFHERSVHADLALAMARQAMLARDDLALVVMSATIDPTPLVRFLDVPLIEIEGRIHPVSKRYRPAASVPAAVRETLQDAQGDILCFLPGAREIERAQAELRDLDAAVLPLHGSLDVELQEQALAPSARRKVILATNVAETSLTVEGVTEVIDSGLHKVLRFDSQTAVDHLVTEQISSDSAEQRAGRAGRTAPGRATRLWDSRSLLRPQREPEIRRVDLSPVVLDIIAWGGDPAAFEWFEAPQPGRVEDALALLNNLGAIEQGRLTPLGEQMRLFPLHPRLARLVLAAGGAGEAIRLALELAEGGPPRAEAVHELQGIVRRIVPKQQALSLPQAALAAYPDRVAARRERNSPRLLLSSGTGAVLAREIEHTPGDFFTVLEMRGEIALRVLPVEREWLTPQQIEIQHSWDGRQVRATRRALYGAIILHEQQIPPDPLERYRLEEENRRVDPALLRRAEFAGVPVDSRELDRLAPNFLSLPSGRRARLEYREDGTVVAAVKLQELFGVAETPRVGPQQVPVTLELLAPNGRPVQITRDLRSFWNGAYQEVRKQLRGRYPKHRWPEDPWSAS